MAYYVTLCHFEQEAMLGVTFVEVGLSSDPILCQYSSRTEAHKVCPQGFNCSKPFYIQTLSLCYRCRLAFVLITVYVNYFTHIVQQCDVKAIFVLF